MDTALNKVKVNSDKARNKGFESVVVGCLIKEAYDLRLRYSAQEPVRVGKELYLLDMYFPDIHLAIECDEDQHANKNNLQEDLVRQTAVSDQLGVDFMRINARDTADQFFSDLNQVILEMRNRKVMMAVDDHDYNTELDRVAECYNQVIKSDLADQLGISLSEIKPNNPYSDCCVRLFNNKQVGYGMWIICYRATFKVAIEYDPKFHDLVKNNLDKFREIPNVTEVGYAREPYILRLTVDNKYFNTDKEKSFELTRDIVVESNNLFNKIIKLL